MCSDINLTQSVDQKIVLSFIDIATFRDEQPKANTATHVLTCSRFFSPVHQIHVVRE